MAKIGRPKNADRPKPPAPDYDEKLAAQLCAHVATGKTLPQACALTHRGLTDDVVFLWLFRSEAFVVAFREAKRSAMYKYLEDTITIADDDSGDTYEDVSKDGDKIDKPNSANVNRAKLKVTARQWAMQNMNREVFGEPVRGQTPDSDGEVIIRIKGGLRPDE